MVKKGFTLIELMVVVAIIAFLAMLVVPNGLRFLAKSKRAEAYMNLNAIYVAQKAYWADNGQYTTTLFGQQGAGWKPEGYKGRAQDENFYYTYGFSGGAEGAQHFTGKLQEPASTLSMTHAGKNSFVAAAAGDIDNDGNADILTINEHGEIMVFYDDLAD